MKVFLLCIILLLDVKKNKYLFCNFKSNYYFIKMDAEPF